MSTHLPATACEAADWLTPAQVCRQMQIARRTLNELERRGILVPVRLSRRCLRYSQADIDRILAAKGGAA